jgi:predicted MFS family arabinose efflux permease
MVGTLPPQPRRPPVKTTTAGSPWRVRAALPSYGTSLLLGYGEGTVTLTLAPLLAHVGSSTADAGFLLAGLSAASAIGGLAYSWLASRIGAPSQHGTDLLLAAAGLLLIPFAVAPSVWLIVLAIAGFGVLIAPINALRTYQLGQALPAHHHAEGFSILYGAMGVGVGISGLTSAAILHAAGPHAPFTVAAIVVLTFTGLFACLSSRRASRKVA